jgi:hypothetical protein
MTKKIDKTPTNQTVLLIKKCIYREKRKPSNTHAERVFFLLEYAKGLRIFVFKEFLHCQRYMGGDDFTLSTASLQMYEADSGKHSLAQNVLHYESEHCLGCHLELIIS